MDIELIEKEIDRLSKELARLKPDDPNYAPVRTNLVELTKILGDYEKRDQDRINNNVRNDINEESVRVDMAKVKTDRLREWLGLVKTGLSIGAGLGMGWIAYQGEIKEFKLPIRSLWDGAKSLIRFK